MIVSKSAQNRKNTRGLAPLFHVDMSIHDGVLTQLEPTSKMPYIRKIFLGGKTMKRFLALALALILCLSMFAGCQEGTDNPTTGGTPSGDKPLAGTYDVKIWVANNMVDLTTQQVADFNANNDQGIVLNATIEPGGEGDAASKMTTDVEAGADLFCFASDQTARLIQAGALSKLGVAATDLVKKSHDAESLAAVTAGDYLYAYPLTSDNGYFMYYDKSVITEDVDITSLEALIAACEAAGKNFSFELENSWYIVSFFFATGCLSEWKTDDNGKFIDVNDNFNSDLGKIAAEGMKKLVTSKCYVNSSTTESFEAAIPSAIVISGTWNYEHAKSVLGENLGIAMLPSFTVEGKSYQLNAFKGCKLLGVKPQADATRAAALNVLAQYLTGEQCQMERFEQKGWGPSNLAAQANDSVKNAPHLKALWAQFAYSRPQGQIHGSWWDIAKVIATSIKDGMAIDKALNNYQASMEALFTMSDEVLNAWTVIGSIGGTNWDADLAMTKQADGTWKSNEAYEMVAATEFNDDGSPKNGTQFKVRQGKSWDNNYGQTFNGANVHLGSLGVEPGTYYVVFNAETGVISVVAE